MVQGDLENIDVQYRTEFSVKALTEAGIAVEELDIQRGGWDQTKGQEIVGYYYFCGSYQCSYKSIGTK